jgi:DNA-binding helix-hairpin-helix protein with protein kinase domain
MHDSEGTSGKRGVRTGIAMIVMAIVASPLVSMLGRLLPSRENTIIDELPAMVLSWALLGIGVAGAVKVVFSVLAARRRSQLRASSRYEQLNQPGRHNVEVNRVVDRSTQRRSTFDTPV